jgi:hypothetical protein
MVHALILAGTVFVLTAIAATWLLVRAYTHHSVWASPDKPVWKDHEECEGYGALTLDNKPLPLEMRAFYRTQSAAAKRHGVFQGAVANVKTCRGCQGLGHVWVSGDAVRRGLPQSLPGEKWQR